MLLCVSSASLTFPAVKYDSASLILAFPSVFDGEVDTALGKDYVARKGGRKRKEGRKGRSANSQGRRQSSDKFDRKTMRL